MTDTSDDRGGTILTHDRSAFRSLAATLTLPQAACLLAAAAYDEQLGRFRTGPRGTRNDFVLESDPAGGPVLGNRTVTTLVARRMVELHLGRLHLTEHGRRVLEGVDDLRRPGVCLEQPGHDLHAQAT